MHAVMLMSIGSANLGRMRRHLRWILLLVAVPVSYFAIMAVHQAVYTATTGPVSSDTIGWALLRLLILLAAVAVPVVFLVCSLVSMNRTYRRARRAQGKYNKYEKFMLGNAQRAADAWEFARAARTDLLAQRVPRTIQQWDVIPYAGEQFFARLDLNYSRYYGQDVGYSQSSAFAFGRPAFVIGVLAVSAIANASARSKAAAQSAPQWREWQTTVVYVSNHRLAVHANGQWLSFDYAAMTAVYPEVDASTLVCQFNSSEPLLLSGDEAAIAAVFTTMQTHGVDGLRGHPALQSLDHASPAPSLPPLGRRA